MIEVEIYFDGACRNVKGSRSEPTGCGVAVFIDKEFSEEFSVAFRGDDGTSNIAEWCACVIAHKIAKEIFELCIEDLERCSIQIFSDSEVITRQINGIYEIKESSFLEYYNVCVKLRDSVKLKETKHIPRELNKKADELSKEGLQKKFSYYYHSESDSFVIEESDSSLIEHDSGRVEFLKQCECKVFTKQELLRYLDSKEKHGFNEENFELDTKGFKHYRSLISE